MAAVLDRGHPALSCQAIDPVRVAAEIVIALQTSVTRRVKAFDPAVITVSFAHVRSPGLVLNEEALPVGIALHAALVLHFAKGPFGS